MKKVLMLVPDLQNKGPIIVMKTIVMSLKNEIHFYIGSLRNNMPENIEEYRKQNIEVFELGMKKTPDLKVLKSLKHLIIEYQIDILHVHCFWPTVLGSMVHSKKVVTVHNNPFEDYIYHYGKLKGSVFAYIQQIALRKYEIVAISKFVRKELLKHHFLRNISVIYNGIVDENLCKERSVNRSGDRTIELTTVSVLNKVKNVGRIIDIFNAALKQNSNLHLNIVGSGAELGNIRKQANKYDCERYINFWGEVSSETVSEILQKTDIFLFTSKSEGFGLAVVEAMREGAVPIVSDIPVMQEIISTGCGYICKENEEFVEKIMKLSDDSEREKMQKSAFIQFNRLFTADKMAENYKQLYLSL